MHHAWRLALCNSPRVSITSQQIRSNRQLHAEFVSALQENGTQQTMNREELHMFERYRHESNGSEHQKTTARTKETDTSHNHGRNSKALHSKCCASRDKCDRQHYYSWRVRRTGSTVVIGLVLSVGSFKTCPPLQKSKLTCNEHRSSSRFQCQSCEVERQTQRRDQTRNERTFVCKPTEKVMEVAEPRHTTHKLPTRGRGSRQ